MEAKVLAYIEKNRLLREGDRVLCAVSGGADSMALLLFLTENKEKLGIETACVHVHHGIRESADRDEEYVRDFCLARDIPCMTYHVDAPAYAEQHGLSLEEAARILRYRALADAASGSGAGKIALAHHKNDQAETVLFHLIRGSGLRGLGGMEPRRRAHREEGFAGTKAMVIRPLLGVTRKEIESFLQERDMDWCEDETNAADDASRNRIRHHVIPALEEIRADAVSRIADTAELLREADEILKIRAGSFTAEHVLFEKGRADIEAEPFRRLRPLLKDYVVADVFRSLGISMKDVGREHLDMAAALADKPVGAHADLPHRTTAERTYETVRIRPSGSQGEEQREMPRYRVEFREFCMEKDMKIPDSEYTKWFDRDKINELPVLRVRKTGDRFSAAAGTHTALKDFMINEKIPREERDRIPLLACGSEILWVVGYRMSEAYKITENTGTVLEISLVEEA